MGAFVTVSRGTYREEFSEIEWHFVRRWNRDDRLLMSLISFSNGTLPDDHIPLLAFLLSVGEAMLVEQIETCSRFADDPLIQEVKRLGLAWRYIGNTVDRVKTGSQVVGDYDESDAPQPATWAEVPAASGAVEKLRRVLAANGTVGYDYAEPREYETF